MNENKRNLVPVLGIVIASLAIAVGIGKLSATSPAITDQINNQSVVNGITVSASSASNVNAAIDMTKQQTVSLWLYATGADTDAVHNVTTVMYPSLDGTLTNADVGHPIQMVKALNTAGVRVCIATNINSDLVSGYRYLVVAYLTNAAGPAGQDATNCSLIVQYKNSLRGGTGL